MKAEVVEEKRVLCAACNQPIKVSHFAGVIKGDDGLPASYCDFITCLLQLNRVIAQGEKANEKTK